MSSGIRGFDGAQFSLALGHVTGYRWWTLGAPDLASSPVHADRNWPFSPLLGQTGMAWNPGVNEAVCSTDSTHQPPVEEYVAAVNYRAPGRSAAALVAAQCGCGFWAYWQPQEHNMGSGPGVLPVLGVIEGTGRTVIGQLGFRCQQARIAALHLPFSIVRTDTPCWPPRWRDTFNQPGMHHPPHGRPSGFASGGLVPGPAQAPSMAQFADWLRDGTEPGPQPEPAREEPDDHAMAWMAVIEDRLAAMYGVTVWSSRKSLLGAFPPDTRYLPEPECTCTGPVCRDSVRPPQQMGVRCPVHMPIR